MYKGVRDELVWPDFKFHYDWVNLSIMRRNKDTKDLESLGRYHFGNNQAGCVVTLNQFDRSTCYMSGGFNQERKVSNRFLKVTYDNTSDEDE